MNDLFDKLQSEDIKAIFDAFPKPMLVINPKSAEFKIIGLNNEFLRLTEAQRKDSIDHSFAEYFPGRQYVSGPNVESICVALKNMLDHSNPVQLENLKYGYVTLNGQIIDTYWNLHFKPIKDKEGFLKFILCFPDNVSEIIKLKEQGSSAKAEIELQQQRLFSAFMQAPFAIAILQGKRHTVKLANTKICSIWGKIQNEVIGRDYFSVTPGYDNQGFRERLDAVLLTGLSWSGKEIPVYFKGKDQNLIETRYFNSLYEPFRDAKGFVQGVIVISVEVTEEVNFRNKIAESENRLNLALEATHLGVWEINRESGEIKGSERYDEIFGESEKKSFWSFEEIRSRVIPEDLEKAIDFFKLAWQKGVLNAQFRVMWPDKSIHWVEMLGRVQYDKLGIAIKMIGTVSEISQLKQTEQLKDQFMGIVSHELRTPVTSLKAYCEFLENSYAQNGNSEAARMLGKMDTQIDKLTRLIADLLDKTKIEEGKMKMFPEFFSFSELIDEIIENIHRLSIRHCIKAEKGSGMMIFADRERVGQVLTNYLTNAIKYSPEGGNIHVKAFKVRKNIVCSVEDFGIGIPADKTKLVFSRFFRVQGHNSETYPGLGLGLYISAELIQRQGGECWVKSKAGSGSTFYFSLPMIANPN